MDPHGYVVAPVGGWCQDWRLHLVQPYPRQLADRAGVRQATVSNAEMGRPVRYATIAAIAGALMVEIEVIAEVVNE